MRDHIEDKTMILSDAEKTKIGELIKVAGKALITTAVKKKIGIDLKETIDSGINALSTEKIKEYDTYFSFNKVLLTIRKEIAEIAKIRPIIIIVDELDRCLPPYTIKVLERLHHVFEGIENVIVIIAMDKTQIRKSLEKIYGDNLDIDRYLRKFISFDLYLDTGKASNFFEKYEQYINLFRVDDGEVEEIEHFMTDLTEGIDIRTQEKIFEKAESLHRLLCSEEKMDASILLFEIVTLCIWEKTKSDNLKWIIDNSVATATKQKIGTEYFEKMRGYEKNGLTGHNISTYTDGTKKVIRENSIGKMLFLISSLYNEVKEKTCGGYYYNKSFENEIIFARQIYKVLST